MDRGWLLERGAAALAAAAALAIVVLGLVEGALVAAGADSYGYVSQAHLWSTGKLLVEPPLYDHVSPTLPRHALAPLGYLFSGRHQALVPAYAPGLPMQMALFERMAGRQAVFWVVPLAGGLAVWSTFLLGRSAAGALGGVLAAAWLATSPAFLFLITAPPMSDLPAAAWWALALALLFRDGRLAAAGAGLAAGVAILIRPNLVPVAVVPGAYLLWRAIVEWRARRVAPARLLLFVAGVVPCCLAVAAINAYLYGSPLASGYDVKRLFGIEHALPNLARYPVLTWEMHTPLIGAALIAPFLLRSKAATAAVASAARDIVGVALAFVLAVFACYLFYPGFDAHWRLRFLLPAIPALVVASSTGLLALAGLAPRPWRVLAAVAATIAVSWHGVVYARDHAAFDTEGEYKYELIGEHIARRLPERAVFLAMQHSGGIRYYSDRPIVRYDRIRRFRLDRVVDQLRRLGYRPYLVLEPWEEPVFRRRFAGASEFGSLDWPPAVELEFAGVRIYDLADRSRAASGEEVSTEILPWPFPH